MSMETTLSAKDKLKIDTKGHEDPESIMRRALVTYIPCKLCKKMQWELQCNDKNECGIRLYENFRQFFAL